MSPSIMLLVAAYMTIWAFVFGYVLWLGRREQGLRREIEMLRKAAEAGGGRRNAHR